MKEIIIEIADNKYNVLVAETEEEKTQGLSNVESMDNNEGLLFDYSNDPQDSLIFNTKKMDFPIDIIFINDDCEVVAVEYGEPKSDEVIECIADEDEKLIYVLELNANSGIKVGDEIDFEDDDITEEEIDKMYILGSDGKPQMDLVGGERIFSRKNSRTLIKLAKKANKSKADSDYAKLGKKIFKYINEQDNRDPEYTSLS
uniref:Uncharacterized protein n=1 Tax=CrAss-like virus sp. ctYsL76 TaxID=2826826 RepID=A0A8S5QM87_9CAUD|nr:MAG TPA: hypothetical protein [CrAss-like virus sp. ctYsL76]